MEAAPRGIVADTHWAIYTQPAGWQSRLAGIKQSFEDPPALDLPNDGAILPGRAFEHPTEVVDLRLKWKRTTISPVNNLDGVIHKR